MEVNRDRLNFYLARAVGSRFSISLIVIKFSQKLYFTLREKCPYSELSGPRFPTFRLNTEKYFVSLRIQSKFGKMRTRITLNTNTFYAASMFNVRFLISEC